MDIAAEEIVRKHLASRISNVAEAGEIRPAAQYFSSVEEYWATVKPSNDTRLEIDTDVVSAAWLYPINFTDDFTSGGADSPLMIFEYEIYLFRQYAAERADESEAPPDVFDTKVLRQHNAFIAAWVGLKQEFQRPTTIAGLSGFVTAQTRPLTQIEDIANQAICEFIPGVIGYAVRLRASVRLKSEDC